MSVVRIVGFKISVVGIVGFLGFDVIGIVGKSGIVGFKISVGVVGFFLL